MDVVAHICELLGDRGRRRVPLLQLVNESGYRESPELLNVDSTASYLSEHEELIDPWLGYSLDKRTSRGWYIRRRAGAFEIGYVPVGERETIAIEDRIRACAEFIVREVQEIVSLFPGSSAQSDGK